MIPPLGRTIPDLVREYAKKSPNAAAVVAPGGTTSYADLRDRSTRLAGALHRRGVRRGQRVGILCANRPEWIEAFCAATALGATAVPLSTWSTRKELEFLFVDSAIAFLFVQSPYGDRNFAADVEAILSNIEELGFSQEDVVSIGDGVNSFMPYAAFLESGEPLEPMAPGEGGSTRDDAYVLYTSGSTSWPKGVRLQHAVMVENGFGIGERQGLRPGDRIYLSAPLFWSYGGANAMPAAFSHGATLVLAERFDAAQAMETIERERCTAIYTLPTMTAAIATHTDFRPERLASLRTGLTIGSEKDFTRAVEVLGISELCNIYGATETYGNCVVTWHHWPVERRMRSQGRPLPGQILRLVDADGREVAQGEEGSVEVGGGVTPGYTGRSAELNSAIFTTDGFYRTGDVARLDANGDFVFVGRDTEMIKRAGINVSPAEVENVLLEHESVAQAAVVGVGDEDRGEIIVAFVIPQKGRRAEPAELVAHCKANASRYKVPDRIVVTDAFPQTATGKLLRRDLKEQAARGTVEEHAP